MSDKTQNLGLDWAEVFGMIISTTSVIVTVLSVFVAYILSRNYLQSIKEMEEIRKQYEFTNTKLNHVSNINNELIKESSAAMRSIFDLLMLFNRRRNYELLRDKLRRENIWKGRNLNRNEMQVYDGRLGQEIAMIDAEALSRETELYWLLGRTTEQSAHLHSLVTTRGDFQTIKLLEIVRAARIDDEERLSLLTAIVALRQRLGLPYNSPSYNSRSWTG